MTDPTPTLADAAEDLAAVAAFLAARDLDGLYPPYIGPSDFDGPELFKVQMMAMSKDEFARICGVIETGAPVVQITTRREDTDRPERVCRRRFGAVLLEGWWSVPVPKADVVTVSHRFTSTHDTGDAA